MGEKVNSQERIIVAVQLLCENHVTGLTNKELAVQVGTSQANICRDLDILQNAEWVVRDTKGRWRLSPRFGGLAGQIAKSYQKSKLLLLEEEEKYLSAMQ